MINSLFRCARAAHRSCQRALAFTRMVLSDAALQGIEDAWRATAKHPMRHEQRRLLLTRRLRAEFQAAVCRAAYRKLLEAGPKQPQQQIGRRAA